MMIYFKLLISILIPFLLGIFGISAIIKNRLSFFSYLERLAIAFASGVWVLIFIMFSLPFINVSLTFQNISLATCLVLLGLAPFCLKNLRYFIPKSLPKSKNLWFYLLLFLIILKLLFVFRSAFLKPIIGPDLMEYYALAAKHTFLNKAPLHLYNEPPLPFLSESWAPINLGTWNDTLLPLFFPFMFVSLIIIFFSSLKRSFTDLYSIFFSFILASIPFLLFHATTAYADFPITFYYSASTIYLFQFFKQAKRCKNKAPSYLLISLILLGISIWVKKSGLYYAGINLSILAIFTAFHRRSIPKKSILFAVLLFAVIASPWLIYDKLAVLLGSLGQAVPYMQRAVASPEILARDKSWIAISAMLRNMFLEGNWQLLWIFFFSTLIFYPGKAARSPHIYLFAILTLQLISLFILFRFTDQFPNILNDTLLNRLMLHFVPIVLYFCAETIASKKDDIMQS